MAKIAYSTKRLGRTALKRIERVSSIIEEYAAQGHYLTMRQLYYRMVARRHLENSEANYNSFGDLIDDGRMAGLIDWDQVVDRACNLRQELHWIQPAEMLRAAAGTYQVDRWQTQLYRIELWLMNREVLLGGVQAAAERLSVPCFACRGYTPQSVLATAVQRFLHWSKQGHVPLLVLLYDHHPYATAIAQDFINRVYELAPVCAYSTPGMKLSQVKELNVPPSPVKLTDSLAHRRYIDIHGPVTWELEALDPAKLAGLIEAEVAQFLDVDLWAETQEREAEDRYSMRLLAERWDAVSAFLLRGGGNHE